MFKILLIVFVVIIIVLTIVVIILATKDHNNDSNNKTDNNNSDHGKSIDNNDEIIQKENAGYFESWNILFGIKLENISYVEGDTIINSFKQNETNYNEEIGIINEGKDYTKNDNNKYTLYIPNEALNKTNKYNGIILFIHGAGEKKENIEHHCKRYAKNGYITATMDYTELFKNIPGSNVFRIMDEITYCLKNIKQKLKNDYQFNENKLELAIGGFSIGSHYSMLYGYSMRNFSPIPIKFIINMVGYLDLDPNYWYKVSEYNSTLSDIEPNSIDDAINNGTLIKYHQNESTYLYQMYGFLGRKFKNDEIGQMLDESKRNINRENELYKSLYKSAKYFFVTYHINNTNDDDFIPFYANMLEMIQTLGWLIINI